RCVESGPAKRLPKDGLCEVAPDAGIDDELALSQGDVHAKRVGVCVGREAQITMRAVIEDHPPRLVSEDGDPCIRKGDAARRGCGLRPREALGTLLTEEPPRRRVEAPGNTSRVAVTKACSDARGDSARVAAIATVE